MPSPKAYRAVKEKPVVAASNGARNTAKNIIRPAALNSTASLAGETGESMPLFQPFDCKKPANKRREWYGEPGPNYRINRLLDCWMDVKRTLFRSMVL